jgi:hypothetical protein
MVGGFVKVNGGWVCKCKKKKWEGWMVGGFVKVDNGFGCEKGLLGGCKGLN